MPEYTMLQEDSTFLLMFVPGPNHSFLNSTFANIASMKKIEGQPKLYLHPIDADDKGIQNGERVRIWNQRGSCTFIACVAQDVLPHVVVSQGLWWQDEDGAYQSVNTLTSQRLSDMGRGATFFSTRVDIEKA